MKITSIEFGVTVNLGNYESSKLTLQAEVQEGEDYNETLAVLQQKVIELSGAKPWIIKNLPTQKNSQEVLKTLEEVQEQYKDKREELAELMYQLRKAAEEDHANYWRCKRTISDVQDNLNRQLGDQKTVTVMRLLTLLEEMKEK